MQVVYPALSPAILAPNPPVEGTEASLVIQYPSTSILPTLSNDHLGKSQRRNPSIDTTLTHVCLLISKIIKLIILSNISDRVLSNVRVSAKDTNLAFETYTLILNYTLWHQLVYKY